MDQLKEVDAIRRHVADAIGMRVIVAGGAVRDALRGERPKDIDLFVTHWGGDPQLGDRVDSVHTCTEENMYRLFLRWEGDVDGFRVQIMQHPAAYEMQALIDCFDWNVCRFAYDGWGVVAGMKIEDVSPGKPLELHRCTFPGSTLRRGFRFSERFGMPVSRYTLQVVANAFVLHGWCISSTDAAKVLPWKPEALA